MAVNYGINLANGVVLGVSSAAIFTADTDVVRVVINQARLVNHALTTAEVQVWILQSGESEIDSLKANVDLVIAPGATELLSSIIGDSVDSGGSVRAISSVATTVSMSMTGTEFTS